MQSKIDTDFIYNTIKQNAGKGDKVTFEQWVEKFKDLPVIKNPNIFYCEYYSKPTEKEVNQLSL